MPSNLLKLSSSSMESEFHNRSDFERSGSFDSQSSQQSRSRSCNFEDENLKYLTNEEKNALMFLEETLDAFEDDLEEPPLSADSSLGYYSPRSTEDSHSDNDDIIDLVQTEHSHVGILPEDSGIGLHSSSWNHTREDSWTSQSIEVSLPETIPENDTEILFPELPVEGPKLHGAIPTPVIIAQKISEKKSDSENMSPLSPKGEKSPELKKNVGTSPIDEGHFIFPGSPNAKLTRFPNNIIIKPVGKQYNKTIAKAAVNVQERKAQMLANLHGPGLFADEIDAKNRHDLLGRRTSFRDVGSEQTRYEALTKLGLVKEIPVQANVPSPDVCKSPVSNGEHPLKMFPPETTRRNSNEYESISKSPVSHGEHPFKMLPPETTRRNSNEYESISKSRVSHGEHPLKMFPTETTRRNSNEHESISKSRVSHGEHPLKMLPPETTRRNSNEHESISKSPVSHGVHPLKMLPPETTRRNSNEHESISKSRVSHGEHPLKMLPPETTRRNSNEHESISKLLMNEPSAFVPFGKTVLIKGEPPSSLERNKRQSSLQAPHEKKELNSKEIKRTYSMPRPAGLRSQGITVQFSGRDSSEKTRKDALRRLGLLSEH